jgi:hypothetical protein
MRGRIENGSKMPMYEGKRMDRTYNYEAHADEEFTGHIDDDERRTGDDRRQGSDRRRQERRQSDSARKARLTPQEIAALLNGSR